MEATMPNLPLRVQQSTSTTGTGSIVLNAAVAGRRNYQDAYGTGATRVAYVISGASFFEIGYGDFDGGSPGNLTRIAVMASSNAGALVSLPVGTADVFPVIDPSERGLATGTGTITLTLADIGNLVLWSGSAAASVTLPMAASVPAGRGWLIANGGSAALTIDPAGIETINNATTLVLSAGTCVEVMRAGSAWIALHAIAGALPGLLASPPAIGGVTPAAGRFTTLATTGATSLGGPLTVSGDITAAGNLSAMQTGAIAGLTLNSSGGDGRVYQLLSYTNGYFAIADVIAGSNRMVIDPAGSVSFIGAAFAPTAPPGTNTTQLATTAFVQDAAPVLFGTAANVTGARALGTVYTNSTGKPMFLSVTARSSGNGAAVQITVGAVALPPGQRTAGSQNNIDVNSTAIVPAGANYLANVTNGTGTLTGWVEIA
jgi:hypothetical protein